MENFIEKVSNMRRLQKKYFKERDPLVLRDAKKAEREVDQMIALHEQKEKQEPKLF